MPEVLREIARNYDIDAIFANRWQGHGVCYCENCRKNFRDATGYDLPTRKAPRTQPVALGARGAAPSLRGSSSSGTTWSRPRSRTPASSRTWAAVAHGVRLSSHREALPVPLRRRPGPPRHRAGLDGRPQRQAHARHLPRAPRRADHLDRSRGGVSLEGRRHHRRRNPGLDRSTARRRAFCPGSPSSTASIPDDRWVEPVVESFDLHAHLEPVLETMAPTAEIAILDPATTLRHHGQETREEAEANDLGFYQALVEAKLPFEMLSDLAMTPASLDRFKVVILANSTCLSDAQAQMLRDYVGRGGSSSPRSRPRPATRTTRRATRIALGELLGVTATGPTRGPLKNTYVALNGNHPIAPASRAPSGSSVAPALIAVESTCRNRGALPLRPRLPRPADGGGLSPRSATRSLRSSRASTRAAGGRSTSPGTSAPSSGRCWPPIMAG